MNMRMKKTTHKLLRDAHSIIIDATGTDVSKTYRSDAYKKVRALYKKIKDVDPHIYKIINMDDNHKTINNG